MHLKKRLILSLFLLLFSGIAKSQSNDCQKFRLGTFRLLNDGNETIIKRIGNFQFEYYNKSTTPMIFSVKWVDDCTYTLLPTKTMFSKYPKLPKNGVVTVQIVKTSKRSYTMQATANFHDKVLVCEVNKIN